METEYGIYGFDPSSGIIKARSRTQTLRGFVERRLLYNLMSSPDQTIDYNFLLDAVWDNAGDRTLIKPRITNIRNTFRRMGDFGDDTLVLANVYRSGYFLTTRGRLHEYKHLGHFKPRYGSF